MLVRREDDGSVLAIGQASHAWVSGQLARAWGNEQLGEVRPWEEVCLGAEQHDLGWAGWDARPTLNPDTGLPYNFVELPIEQRLEIWSGAAQRLVSQSRYAALLVSMHGTAIHERWGPHGNPDVDAYVAAEKEFQERLFETVGAGRDEVRRNQRLVWTWDAISLALCNGWGPTPLEQVPAAADELTLRYEPLGDGRAELEPWPFADDSVSLRAEGRRLEGRFGDEAELHDAFERAPWVTLEFELVRRGRG